jgi:hypothetical protein
MRYAISAVLFLTLVCGNAATYYVATTGNDSNPGSIGSPFLTVQKGFNTAQPGDTVFIGAGNYPENVISQRDGATNSNITFDGQSVATVQSLFLNNSYHDIKNLTISGRTNSFLMTVGRNTDWCTFSNNTFNASNVVGLAVVTSTGPVAQPFGDAASFNLWISNTFENCVGSLVLGVFGDSNRFVLNTFKNGDSCDWMRFFGRDHYIAFNTYSNVLESGISGNHPDWVQTFGSQGFGSSGHIFERNFVTKMVGAGQLCMLSGDDVPEVRDWTFRDNLFTEVDAKGTMGIRDVKWYNNVFYRCATISDGHVLIYTMITNLTYTNFMSNGGHGGQVYNNVFLECGDDRTTVGWYSFSLDLTNIVADYNYTGKTNFSQVFTDPMQRSIGDPGGWDFTRWWEDNGINGGDPSFVSIPNDFHLQAISILRNAGYAVVNPFDYDGVAWDSPPSIGAFEFVSGDDPPCEELPRAIRAYSVSTTNSINLFWPDNTYRQVIRIDKRIYTNHPVAWQTWTNILSQTNAVTGADSFNDTDVTSGVAYEYQISTLITNYTCVVPSDFPYWDYQYIIAGTEVPLKDERGNLVLLVESGVAASLTTELDRLESDFIGDGYKVFRHDVAAVDVDTGGWPAAVAATKALIVSDYNTDTNSDWTIFIVGHVPVPYSGLSSPGSHTENFGAQPADWYYADMTASVWTDTTANDSTADYPSNWNVPGDGKFDQSSIPSFPEMRVGRIDLRNMPAFGMTEAQLLAQYLDRNHSWRHKEFTVRERGIINTNGIPFEQWSLNSGVFGTTIKSDLGHWLEEATNTTSSYLFAASKGSGSFTKDNQLGWTTNFANTQLYAAFTTMYGSYYGDWDSSQHSNVVILAPLSTVGYVLTTYYRENVVNWSSGMIGETIGQELYEQASNLSALGAKRYTQYGWITGGSTFQSIQFPKNYVSLLGDPTLRFRVAAPPTDVEVNASGSDNIVSWGAADDDNIVGYHVYRAPSNDLNDFTRLTTVPDTASPYTDAGASSGDYVYMVRSVKLEDESSRSFFNASQGVFADSDPPPPSDTGGVIAQGTTIIQGKAIVR